MATIRRRIDATQAEPLELYRHLIGVVAPRPIAWVSTIDGEGRVNLAPFSFSNLFGANPPIVAFSPVRRRDGSKKDTLLNVEEVGEFVWHAATRALAERVNQTSAEQARGVSEAELAGLTLEPSEKVRPPRVAESPMALECRVERVLEFGDGPLAPSLVVGRVLLIHLDEAILAEDADSANGPIDPARLDPVARMGGDTWSGTRDRFVLRRP